MNENVSEFSQRSTLPDRAILRAQLEETRSAFHALLESLAGKESCNRNTSTGWTIRELMVHIVNGLDHILQAIEHVRLGKNYLNLPPHLNWLSAPINFWLTKYSARAQTYQTLHIRYDTTHLAMLATLESIRDDEWSRGAQCFGDGYKTVLDLCILPNTHFLEHAAQIPV